MRKRDDGSEQVVNSEGYERSAKQIQGNENYIRWTDNRNKDEDTRTIELRIKIELRKDSRLYPNRFTINSISIRITIDMKTPICCLLVKNHKRFLLWL